MERRDILKASALFLGYGLVGGTSLAVLNGCQADARDDWEPTFFTAEEIDTIAEAAERIIPKTDTPGAKDALVHRYIDMAVPNNFKPEEQQKIKMGIALFDKIANEKYDKNFVKLTDEQMDAVLQDMADMSKKKGNKEEFNPIFRDFKSLVAVGYFTSEPGATQALVYDPIPGPYQGCIPLADVGGAYALPSK